VVPVRGRTRRAVNAAGGAIVRTQIVQQRFRAGNGTRTRDPNLGKVVLYQLSYSRARPAASAARATRRRPVTRGGAALVLRVLLRVSNRAGDGGEGNRTPDLLNAIQALSQLSYAPGNSLGRHSLRRASRRSHQQPQEPQSLAGGIPCVKRSTLAETAWVSILQRPTGSVRRSGVPGLVAWVPSRRTVVGADLVSAVVRSARRSAHDPWEECRAAGRAARLVWGAVNCDAVCGAVVTRRRGARSLRFAAKPAAPRIVCHRAPSVRSHVATGTASTTSPAPPCDAPRPITSEAGARRTRRPPAAA
jgi:hypothetical protein